MAGEWGRDCGWGVGEGLWLGSGGGTVVVSIIQTTVNLVVMWFYCFTLFVEND